MNTQSEQSGVLQNVAPQFKKASLLPYALVVALSSVACFGFCKFTTNQAIESNVAITKSISTSVLVAEHYIESNLKCATTALHMYLDHNPMPKKKEDLWKLRDDVGVSGFSLYGKGGNMFYTSTNLIEKEPEFFRTYSFKKGSRCEQKYNDMMTSSDNTMLHPIGNSKRGFNDLTMKTWFEDKQIFANSYVNIPELTDIFKENAIDFNNVERIVLSSPSGVVILDTDSASDDLSRRMIDLDVAKYGNKPLVKNSFGDITISLPFGGLKEACISLKDDNGAYGGAANDAGQYFYVMNVTFDKTALNKQLAIIIAGFVMFALFVCIAIYYINAYSAKSSELADLSERMGDKVTQLCNARLGEVRRYVTKIAKDSMRVNNMNKELPPEMVDLLDRAFREVGEVDKKSSLEKAPDGNVEIEDDKADSKPTSITE